MECIRAKTLQSSARGSSTVFARLQSTGRCFTFSECDGPSRTEHEASLVADGVGGADSAVAADVSTSRPRPLYVRDAFSSSSSSFYCFSFSSYRHGFHEPPYITTLVPQNVFSRRNKTKICLTTTES